MKKILLSLLAVTSMSTLANDWVDFHPKHVVDVTDQQQLDPLLQPAGTKNASGGITPNVVTATWWPIVKTITALTRSNTVWSRADVPLTPTGAWTFQTFKYTWLITGGWTNDQYNMDMMACVHFNTPWQACGDVRNTKSSPEVGSSDFAVSFPVQCWQCPDPAVLSLFLKVPLNSLDPTGAQYATHQVSVSFAAGTGKLYYTS